MGINVKIQTYRGTLSDLETLASTGAAGVLAWTTDSNELYMDKGTGTGIVGVSYGSPAQVGSAWQRLAPANNLWTGQPSTNLSSFTTALVGDLAIANDNDSTYLLTAYPPTVLGNWVAIAASSSQVSSVNGQTGTVTLDLDQIPDGVTYARILAASITDGEFDLAKSHAFGFTPDNLIQGAALGAWPDAQAVSLGFAINVGGNVFQVVQAGTTGSSQPTFITSHKGVTTADNAGSPPGNVVWEFIGTAVTVTVQWEGSATPRQWVSYIDNNGVQHTSQPSFSDIAGTLSQTQLPASIGSGSNLTSIDCGSF